MGHYGVKVILVTDKYVEPTFKRFNSWLKLLNISKGIFTFSLPTRPFAFPKLCDAKK